MTLTNRLTLFSLATLAVVLLGFSAALYLLARHHLHGQLEERLEAAVNTLRAAAEVKPDGVEWESAGRRLTLAPSVAAGEPAWLIADGEGRAIERSVPADSTDFVDEVAGHLRTESSPGKRMSWRGSRWLFRQEWLRVANAETPPRPEPVGTDSKYPALSITVGLSLEPVKATLRHLGAALTGLSVTIWLVALVAGRAWCRRALRPVSRMAASAREMRADDLGRRLPPASTGDELEDLGRSFNGLLDRLQESFERQQRFTGDASHQLRTPLAAMLGQVEVALRRDRPADEYQRVLGSVREQAGRLGQIVESLLFLARADAEARLPGREHIELADWLARHLRTWTQHRRGGDITLDTNEPAWAEVHPTLLGELINLLLDNACKYSEAGTPITVGLNRTGDRIELSVRDEGPGMAAEDVSRVFEPFFRSEDARRRGVQGLGLGLAIARRLADALGGSLSATSQPGGGSEFTLRLPALSQTKRDGSST